MNTRADKTPEHKSRSPLNRPAQMPRVGESAFQFIDNRPEIVAQRKLQEMANNGPQVSQLSAFQEMADTSSQARQTAQFQSMADNNSQNKLLQKREIEEEEPIQEKKLNTSAQFAGADSAPPPEDNPIQEKNNNTGLPDNLKTGMENLSGISLDDVTVHRNSETPAQLQAHAYAQGTEIHLAPGQEKHLPHEAWHVVQQKQGRVKPTMQMKGKVNVNDDAGLEKEADAMGIKARQFKQKPSTPPQNPVFRCMPIVQRTEDEKIKMEGTLRELPYQAKEFKDWISEVKKDGALTDDERIVLFNKVLEIVEDYEAGIDFTTSYIFSADEKEMGVLAGELEDSISGLKVKGGEGFAWTPTGIATHPAGGVTMWAEGGGKEGQRINKFHDWLLGSADESEAKTGMNCWEFILFSAINGGELTKEAVLAWYQEALAAADTAAASQVLKTHMISSSGGGANILDSNWPDGGIYTFKQYPKQGQLVIAGNLDHVAIGAEGGKVLSLGHGAMEDNLNTLYGSLDPIKLEEAFGKYLIDKRNGEWEGEILIYEKSWKG